MDIAGCIADALDPRVVFDDSVEPASLVRIWISNTRFALVDLQDVQHLSTWRWSEHFNEHGNLYVSRLQGAWPGKRQRFFMHRIVMLRVGPPPSPEHRYVDHKNGDTLDNRRANLRWATPSMNAKNTWLNRIAHGVPE